MTTKPKIPTIITSSIGNAWLESIGCVLSLGEWIYDNEVRLIETHGLVLLITDPIPHDPLITECGDLEVLERMHNKFKSTFESKASAFTYGERIYDFNNVNQFDWMIARLKRKPETKSATICLLQPGDNADSLPCLTTIDAKLRNGKLNMSFFFRSSNVLGRLYANLSALAALQEEAALLLDAKAASMRLFIASAHIYEFDVEIAKLLSYGKRPRIKDLYYEKGPSAK